MEMRDPREPFFSLDGDGEPFEMYSPEGGISENENTFDEPGILPTQEEPSEPTIADPEIAELVAQSSQIIGPEATGVLLQASNRFNKPVYFRQPDGSHVVDNYAVHRQLLKDIPVLTEAGEAAGLPPDKSIGLLAAALHNTEYSEDSLEPHALANRLSRIMRAAAKNDMPLSSQDLEAVHGFIAQSGAKYYIRNGLLAVERAQAAGLSIEQGIDIVGNLVDTTGSRRIDSKGYHIRHTLEVLNVAGADPEHVAQVFRHISELPPEQHSATYEGLAFLLSRITPVVGRRADEVLRILNSSVDGGMDIYQVMSGYVGNFRVERDGNGLPLVTPEEFFTPWDRELVHASIPYRTVRSFSDGMEDIIKLTDAQEREGDIVAEGFWVFDPGTGTWYCLGGETVVDGGALRQSVQAYDLSRLSEKPVQVHIHPRDLAPRPGDRVMNALPTPADINAAVQLRNLTRSPVELRTLIAHSIGITEFTHTSDTGEGIRAGELLRTIRRAHIHAFESFEIFDAFVASAGDELMAQTIIDELNEHLPAGYRVRLYPRGTLLSGGRRI